MTRDVPFNPNAKCDTCGRIGAYDFMGDYICTKCSEIPSAIPPSPNPLPTTEGVTQGWPVPDGWKLVPIEPTEDMLLASWMAQYIIAGATEQEAVEIAKRRWAEEKSDVFKAYSVMIAAAPLPHPPGQ